MVKEKQQSIEVTIDRPSTADTSVNITRVKSFVSQTTVKVNHNCVDFAKEQYRKYRTLFSTSKHDTLNDPCGAQLENLMETCNAIASGTLAMAIFVTHPMVAKNVNVLTDEMYNS